MVRIIWKLRKMKVVFFDQSVDSGDAKKHKDIGIEK